MLKRKRVVVLWKQPTGMTSPKSSRWAITYHSIFPWSNSKKAQNCMHDTLSILDWRERQHYIKWKKLGKHRRPVVDIAGLCH